MVDVDAAADAFNDAGQTTVDAEHATTARRIQADLPDNISDLFAAHDSVFFLARSYDANHPSEGGSSLDTCKLPYRSSRLAVSGGGDSETGLELAGTGERATPAVAHDVVQGLKSASDERAEVVHALLDEGEIRHARRFVNCGRWGAEVRCPDAGGGCGKTHVVPTSCGSRLCPDCMDRKMGKLIGKYRDAVQSWRSPTLLTLTVENTSDPVKAKDRLTDAFARYRRRVVPASGGTGDQRWTWKRDDGEPAAYYWKQNLTGGGRHDLAGRLQVEYVDAGRGVPMKELIDGGFYGVDIKQNAADDFNVHLHVLANMAYVPQPALSEVWGDVTGGDAVLDVRRVRETPETGLADAIVEVIGYATKPPEWNDADAAVDVLMGLKGSCLVQPFGSLYGDVDDLTELVCPHCKETPNWWDFIGLTESPPTESVDVDDEGDRPPPEEGAA